MLVLGFRSPTKTGFSTNRATVPAEKSVRHGA